MKRRPRKEALKFSFLFRQVRGGTLRQSRFVRLRQLSESISTLLQAELIRAQPEIIAMLSHPRTMAIFRICLNTTVASRRVGRKGFPLQPTGARVCLCVGCYLKSCNLVLLCR